MSSERISVIIPVHDGERYLAQSIQSVFNQNVAPAEIIVIDDGSTDSSAAIAQSYAPLVRYLHQPNLGPAAARNLGVSHATGDLLAFIDADDLWTPDKLRRQLSVLTNDPACAAVLGRVENFISPELNEEERRPLTRAAIQTGDIHIGALLIRQTAFRQVGLFDVRWRQSDFVEWWARAMRHNLVYTVLPDMVLRRRLHANNLTRREKAGRQEYVPMLREQLAQRRAAAARQNLATPEEET